MRIYYLARYKHRRLEEARNSSGFLGCLFGHYSDGLDESIIKAMRDAVYDSRLYTGFQKADGKYYYAVKVVNRGVVIVTDTQLEMDEFLQYAQGILNNSLVLQAIFNDPARTLGIGANPMPL